MKGTSRRLFILVFLSFLLHLLMFLIWWVAQSEQPEKAHTKTITVQIKPQPIDLKNELVENQPPEPEPEPEPEQILPIDNADQFSSSNQQDKTINEIVLGEASAEKKGEFKVRQESSSDLQDKQATVDRRDDITQLEEVAQSTESKQDVEQIVKAEAVSSKMSERQVSKKQLTETQQKEASQGQSPEPMALPMPSYQDYFSGILLQEGEEETQADDYIEELVTPPGNVALLADNEMSDVVVQQPFSELKSKELKLANEFLERMNQQVLSVWQNPYKGKHLYRGIIKLELDEEGYLQDVFIFRASGHPALDASVIAAIRAVTRFKIPENKIIASRYYRNLRFHYSSIESKTELMPFEQEAKQKE